MTTQMNYDKITHSKFLISAENLSNYIDLSIWLVRF